MRGSCPSFSMDVLISRNGCADHAALSNAERTTPSPEQMQMPQPTQITPNVPSPAQGLGAGIETIRADGARVQ